MVHMPVIVLFLIFYLVIATMRFIGMHCKIMNRLQPWIIIFLCSTLAVKLVRVHVLRLCIHFLPSMQQMNVLWKFWDHHGWIIGHILYSEISKVLRLNMTWSLSFHRVELCFCDLWCHSIWNQCLHIVAWKALDYGSCMASWCSFRILPTATHIFWGTNVSALQPAHHMIADEEKLVSRNRRLHQW